MLPVREFHRSMQALDGTSSDQEAKPALDRPRLRVARRILLEGERRESGPIILHQDLDHAPTRRLAKADVDVGLRFGVVPDRVRDKIPKNAAYERLRPQDERNAL